VRDAIFIEQMCTPCMPNFRHNAAWSRGAVMAKWIEYEMDPMSAHVDRAPNMEF